MRTQPERGSEEWADAETDRFFSTIGRYVVFFQMVEAKVDESLLLLWGHENWKTSQARLTNMRNEERVDALLAAFRDCPENERGRTRPEWVRSFEALIEDLHEERRQRNSLLHSHFLFDFMKIGYPILQVDRKARKAGKPDADLTEAVQKGMLDRVIAIYMRVARAHLQLVHDYGAASANAT